MHFKCILVIWCCLLSFTSYNLPSYLSARHCYQVPAISQLMAYNRPLQREREGEKNILGHQRAPLPLGIKSVVGEILDICF